MARTERCSIFPRGRTRGADAIAITKLDVLDDLDKIPVCVAYRLDGRPIDSLPPLVEDVARLEPVYETLPGWRSKTTAVTRYEDLPSAAVRYVRFLEEAAGASAAFIATGPRRDHPPPRLGFPRRLAFTLSRQEREGVRGLSIRGAERRIKNSL